MLGELVTAKDANKRWADWIATAEGRCFFVDLLGDDGISEFDVSLSLSKVDVGRGWRER